MLALLECVVKQDGVTEESLRPHAGTLLKEMVLPNAVWRAGLVAATVRKVRCRAVLGWGGAGVSGAGMRVVVRISLTH